MRLRLSVLICGLLFSVAAQAGGLLDQRPTMTPRPKVLLIQQQDRTTCVFNCDNTKRDCQMACQGNSTCVGRCNDAAAQCTANCNR